MLTLLSDNLLKLEYHSGSQNWADEALKDATANVVLYSVLAQKSETNINDSDLFPQASVDVFW